MAIGSRFGADTPKDVIYTAYFAHSTHLLAQAAEVLGKTDDAAQYRALFNGIKTAFNRAYIAPDGRIKGNTQARYVMAIAFDLVDGERAKKAARYLIEDIEKRGNHLSTGFIGTKSLMHALSQDRPPGRGISITTQRLVPFVGLFDQARCDQHLGALGRLDA